MRSIFKTCWLVPRIAFLDIGRSPRRTYCVVKRADFETKVRRPALNNKKVEILVIRCRQMDTATFSLGLETLAFSFTSASGTNFGGPEIVCVSQISHVLISLLRRLLYKCNHDTDVTSSASSVNYFETDPPKPIFEEKAKKKPRH